MKDDVGRGEAEEDDWLECWDSGILSNHLASFYFVLQNEVVLRTVTMMASLNCWSSKIALQRVSDFREKLHHNKPSLCIVHIIPEPNQSAAGQNAGMQLH